MTSGVDICLDTFWRAAAPRHALTVSEWADRHRILTGKQAGERGPWRTRRTPFLREIMDAMSFSARCRDIVVMKSSQVGVTEATVNFLGYLVEHAPAPAMVLMPTIEARDAWKAQKLNPLLQETPVVRDLLGGNRSRDAANRQDMIDFPGGVLFLAGGNSPNSYAQRSARVVIMDDLDRFPGEIGDEGDPVRLAEGRTKAFARPKRVLISTPTVADTSLIAREYGETDQRRYHVPCPHCGEYQPLEWGGPETPHGIKWQAIDGKIIGAHYVCRACHAPIAERHKPGMLEAGRWIAAYPDRPRRGYHLTALMAPIGLGPSWLDLAVEWQTACKSPGTLRTFVNTHLGEPWVEQGEQIEAAGLIARLEDFEQMPKPLIKSVGVDVQKDRLEATVIGWQLGEEAWVMDHLIVAGDTARPDTWARLDAELADWGIEALGVDSGYNASMVYEFVAKKAYAFALKGMDGGSRPIVEDERTIAQRLRKRRKRGVPVYIVGVDQAKALLHARLKLQEPGPGYIHFANDPAFDDEYFAQLTAEKLVTKIRGTRPYQEWVQTRPRNEALDCFNYAVAALRLRLSAARTTLEALAMKRAEESLSPTTPQRGRRRVVSQPRRV